MTLLVDTSALYALMDRDDPNHVSARAFWSTLPERETPLTHNYVVLETSALVQRRLGVPALRSLVDDVLQPVSTIFVDDELHRTAVATVLAAGQRDVSLVDRVSFEVMRRFGLANAFAYDAHFAQLGFQTLPT